MHASTTHTLFYVNGLHHPRIPALIQSDYGLRGGVTRSDKNRFSSCSSRIIVHADTFDDDVDNVDIDAIGISSKNDAAAISDSDDDAEHFSIVNEYASGQVETFAEEEKNLLAARTKRTGRHNNESAENFLLT